MFWEMMRLSQEGVRHLPVTQPSLAVNFLPFMHCTALLGTSPNTWLNGKILFILLQYLSHAWWLPFVRGMSIFIFLRPVLRLPELPFYKQTKRNSKPFSPETNLVRILIPKRYAGVRIIRVFVSIKLASE